MSVHNFHSNPSPSLGDVIALWCMDASARQISDMGGNSAFLLSLELGSPIAWVPFTKHGDVGYELNGDHLGALLWLIGRA